MLDTEMLIGAKFVAGSGEPYPVLNARTGETIGATWTEIDLHAAGPCPATG